MGQRWGWLLLPSVLVSGLLMVASQALFLRMSLYRDLSFGRVRPDLTMANYLTVLGDPFYLHSLVLTVEVAAIVLVCSLLSGYAAAYVLVRMPPLWASLLLAAILATALVAEIIKVLGLVILFSADGLLNQTLLRLGIVARPLTLLGTVPGVVVGILHFTIGFVTLLLYSVLRTIPRSLEEAARLHGASPLRVFWRVVLPLSLPGVVAGGLVVFNLAMGAFTAAALLGGGRILTLPVLIERTMILETRYAISAALAAVLMALVLVVNLIAAAALARLPAGYRVADA